MHQKQSMITRRRAWVRMSHHWRSRVTHLLPVMYIFLDSANSIGIPILLVGLGTRVHQGNKKSSSGQEEEKVRKHKFGFMFLSMQILFSFLFATKAISVPKIDDNRGFWVCGAGSAEVNGLYEICDEVKFMRWAKNGTCGTFAEKHLLYYDQLQSGNWLLYTLFPLGNNKTYYQAPGSDQDLHPPNQNWTTEGSGASPVPKVIAQTEPSHPTC